MSTASPTRTADATEVRTLRNYVGGRFVEAATNEHLDVTEPATGTPEAFASYIKSETVKWAKVIKASGAKPE